MTTEALIEPFLTDLVSIPSISHRAEACAHVLDKAEELLGSGHGLHVERLRFEETPCMIVSTKPSRDARIILNAHLDVVPARPEQFVPRLESGRLHARGAYDMKGAAAVYLALLRAVAALPTDRRPDLQVQFVTDEEVGGHFGAMRLQQAGYKADLFIAGEPTDLAICHRAKGILWLTLLFDGKPGHAAMPWETQNPITTVLEGLRAVEARFPVPSAPVWATTVTVTNLSAAGEAHNRVPASARLDLDVRRIPDDSEESILEFMRDTFPTAQLEVLQRGQALDTAADHPQVKRVADLQEKLTGERPRFYGEHFGSDARYWSVEGVPAICWGPRGAGMHGDDEWVDLDSLQTYYKLVSAVVGLT
jgi:succinyl-diaminopimelate desuccinylase